MMKTGLRRLLALALGAGLLTANTYAAATTFTDVPTTYWGYYYIDRARHRGAGVPASGDKPVWTGADPVNRPVRAPRSAHVL